MPEEVLELTTEELRLHLGERIPDDGEEEDTNFTDEELLLIIERARGDFYASLALGWAAKAGIYTDLVDINENGSDRKLEQAWKHADKQASRFEKLATFDITQDLTFLRVAGAKGIDAWGGTSSDDAHTISLFNPDSAYETRLYPLKRFPQIKQ